MGRHRKMSLNYFIPEISNQFKSRILRNGFLSYSTPKDNTCSKASLKCHVAKCEDKYLEIFSVQTQKEKKNLIKAIFQERNRFLVLKELVTSFFNIKC